MTIRDIAREWLRRPMVILICGRGEYASLLIDGEFATVVHVRSRLELDTSLRHPPIDAAIVEDPPWPKENASSIANLVRARGVGVVFAARTAESGTRLLRERHTVDLRAVGLRDRLDDAIWLACVETEVMRRDSSDWWNTISSSAAPAFMRFVAQSGHLAPSQSTCMFMFNDANVPAADGGSPLVAPSAPAPWSHGAGTVVMQPSESLLRSLRRTYKGRLGIVLPWLWTALGIGAVCVVLFLMRFLWP